MESVYLAYLGLNLKFFIVEYVAVIGRTKNELENKAKHEFMATHNEVPLKDFVSVNHVIDVKCETKEDVLTFFREVFKYTEKSAPVKWGDCGEEKHAQKIADLFPDINAMAELIAEYNANHPVYTHNVAQSLMEQGYVPITLDEYKAYADIQEKESGKDHPETATAYNNIAVVCLNLGDHDGSLKWAKKAMKIRENALGLDHTDTADTYHCLGRIYSDKRDYETAAKWYGKALAIYKKVYGVDHLQTASVYNNIGKMFYIQGANVEAMNFYDKALAIRKHILGEEHPATIEIYNNIDKVYSQVVTTARR